MSTGEGVEFNGLFAPAIACYNLDIEAENAKRHHQGPKYFGGEPVFRGTRVPFKVLIDYLEGGETLDQFLEQYPSVTRELAVAAIEEARSSLVSQLR